MNIKEAKNEIKNTVAMYLEKDENGEYLVPTVRQRPVFLVGAPGIGKTAIMEQIASELDIALVSYSMTHHTRQSAIGLPYLTEKTYNGKKYTISEYTMSEIIASIYEVIEKTDKKEGILFLDEINCVSETLAPSMLLFLQYKRFGNESIPEGWVVVTAGNPPQFNKSVKEFDVATLDRLKYMQVEENYTIWKEYASSSGLHPAILAYLDSNESHFYKISTTVDGKQYVTARGWEDLSAALRGYERNHFEISSSLIMQYITIPEIARKFSAFYDLFIKYKESYEIQNILTNAISSQVLKKASNARFDERLSVISLLRDILSEHFQTCIISEEALELCVKRLRVLKKQADCDIEAASFIQIAIDEFNDEIKKKKFAGNYDYTKGRVLTEAYRIMTKYKDIAVKTTKKGIFKLIQTAFNNDAKAHDAFVKQVSFELANAFKFIRDAWSEGQEMTLFVTELTMNKNATLFIAQWGSPDYYKYNCELLVYDRDSSLKEEIAALLEK